MLFPRFNASYFQLTKMILLYCFRNLNLKTEKLGCTVTALSSAPKRQRAERMCTDLKNVKDILRKIQKIIRRKWERENQLVKEYLFRLIQIEIVYK